MNNIPNKPVDVALVTSAEFPQLTDDDRLLLDALQMRGFNAQPAVWDDPAVDWSQTRICVLRSTWDYHQRRDEFLVWAKQVAGVTQLWNPLEALRWNTHKGYLRDLSVCGVPIVPTTWIEAGSSADLPTLMNMRGWEQLVIKPAVSASAYETVLVDRSTLSEGQAHLDRLLPTRDLMLQPFMASVDTYGERSFIFIDGEFSHAVRKPSVLHDPTWAAEKYVPVSASDDELRLAIQALQATGFPTLYARVDIVRDDTGMPRLMELELVEPSLWLGLEPGAAERFADGIVARLSGHHRGLPPAYE